MGSADCPPAGMGGLCCKRTDVSQPADCRVSKKVRSRIVLDGPSDHRACRAEDTYPAGKTHTSAKCIRRRCSRAYKGAPKVALTVEDRNRGSSSSTGAAIAAAKAVK